MFAQPDRSFPKSLHLKPEGSAAGGGSDGQGTFRSLQDLAQWIEQEFAKRGLDEDDRPSSQEIQRALEFGISCQDILSYTPGELAQKIALSEGQEIQRKQGRVFRGTRTAVPLGEITDELINTVHRRCCSNIANSEDCPSKLAVAAALRSRVDPRIIETGKTHKELREIISSLESSGSAPIVGYGLPLIAPDLERAASLLDSVGFPEWGEKIRQGETIPPNEKLRLTFQIHNRLSLSAQYGELISSQDRLFLQKVLAKLAEPLTVHGRIAAWAETEGVDPYQIPTEKQLGMFSRLGIDPEVVVGKTRDEVSRIIDERLSAKIKVLATSPHRDDQLYAVAHNLRQGFWNEFGTKRALEQPKVTTLFTALDLGIEPKELEKCSEGDLEQKISFALKAEWVGVSYEEAKSTYSAETLEQEFEKLIVAYLEARRSQLIESINTLLGIKLAVGTAIPTKELGHLEQKIKDNNLEIGCAQLERIMEVSGTYQVITSPAQLVPTLTDLRDRGDHRIPTSAIDRLSFVSAKHFHVTLRTEDRDLVPTNRDGVVTYSHRTAPKPYVVEAPMVRLSTLIQNLRSLDTPDAELCPIDPFDIRCQREDILKKGVEERIQRAFEVGKSIYEG